ncbi:MAG TPA: TOMM precursor leader peptide-binding protein [Solirubrobacterales bacterium]|nr:TOMM precursor leader peptide-binding protein [Solirubrobacterales bacterium]
MIVPLPDKLAVVSERDALLMSPPSEGLQQGLEYLREGSSLDALQGLLGAAGGEALVDQLDARGLLCTEPLRGFEGTEQARQAGYLAQRTGRPSRAQARIRGARVAIVGVGGVGGVMLQHLIGAGARRFVLVDHDRVEPDNLNRQFVYGRDDLGVPKVEAAAAYIERVTTQAEVRTLPQALTNPAELEEALDSEALDFLILAADRPLPSLPRDVNDYCLGRGLPFIVLGIGLEIVNWGPLVAPGSSACWRCVEELLDRRAGEDERRLKEAMTAPTSQSFGPVNTIGSALAARDVIDWIAGATDVPSVGTLLSLDLQTLTVSRFPAGPCEHPDQ